MKKEIKISGIVAVIAYLIVITVQLIENGLEAFFYTFPIEYALVIYIAVLLTLKVSKQE